MTIEIKFKPGDTVFFMHGSRARATTINEVRIAIRNTHTIVQLLVRNPDNNIEMEPMEERWFFATKAELIASL